MRAPLAALTIVCAGGAAQAQAAEVILGVYAHDVTFLGEALGVGAAGREGGTDVHLGLRSERIDGLRLIGRPQAHAFVSLNSENTSNFVAAGLSWPVRLGGRFYFRPGLGLAYTDGKAELPAVNAPNLPPEEIQRRLRLFRTRIDFGSRLLFEPELNLGLELSERWRAELSWVHLSNGQILHHGKNQGLDEAGVRVIYRLGR